MPNTYKNLPRPPLRSESPKPTDDLYDPVKLPDKGWDQRGKELILSPDIKRSLVRYGLYRLAYGATAGTSGLMMLTGPPGTGKSDAARWAASAIIRACSTTGIGVVINTDALFDENLGASPKRVRGLFEAIEFSAQRQMTVLIWDDAEGIFMDRRQILATKDPTDCIRVTTTLNAGLDRLRFYPHVVQFATLNIAGVVDEAIASRSDLVLPFPLPDTEQRCKILSYSLKGTAGERVLAALAEATQGLSGRDLTKIDLKAFLKGSGNTREDLTEADYLRAVGLTPPAVTNAAQGVLPEAGNTDMKEETEPCQKLSTNGFRGAALLQKSKSLLLWRRFNPQPTS